MASQKKIRAKARQVNGAYLEVHMPSEVRFALNRSGERHKFEKQQVGMTLKVLLLLLVYSYPWKQVTIGKRETSHVNISVKLLSPLTVEDENRFIEKQRNLWLHENRALCSSQRAHLPKNLKLCTTESTEMSSPLPYFTYTEWHTPEQSSCRHDRR